MCERIDKIETSILAWREPGAEFSFLGKQCFERIRGFEHVRAAGGEVRRTRIEGRQPLNVRT